MRVVVVLSRRFPFFFFLPPFSSPKKTLPFTDSGRAQLILPLIFGARLILVQAFLFSPSMGLLASRINERDAQQAALRRDEETWRDYFHWLACLIPDCDDASWTRRANEGTSNGTRAERRPTKPKPRDAVPAPYRSKSQFVAYAHAAAGDIVEREWETFLELWDDKIPAWMVEDAMYGQTNTTTASFAPACQSPDRVLAGRVILFHRRSVTDPNAYFEGYLRRCYRERVADMVKQLYTMSVTGHVEFTYTVTCIPDVSSSSSSFSASSSSRNDTRPRKKKNRRRETQEEPPRVPKDAVGEEEGKEKEVKEEKEDVEMERVRAIAKRRQQRQTESVVVEGMPEGIRPTFTRHIHLPLDVLVVDTRSGDTSPADTPASDQRAPYHLMTRVDCPVMRTVPHQSLVANRLDGGRTRHHYLKQFRMGISHLSREETVRTGRPTQHVRNHTLHLDSDPAFPYVTTYARLCTVMCVVFPTINSVFDPSAAVIEPMYLPDAELIRAYDRYTQEATRASPGHPCAAHFADAASAKDDDDDGEGKRIVVQILPVTKLEIQISLDMCRRIHTHAAFPGEIRESIVYWCLYCPALTLRRFGWTDINDPHPEHIHYFFDPR